MKYEPLIDRARLLAATQQAYSLPLVSLEFLPVGYAAASYIARVDRNTAYFLKLWPDVRTRRRAMARLLRRTVILSIPPPDARESVDPSC